MSIGWRMGPAMVATTENWLLGANHFQSQRIVLKNQEKEVVWQL